MDIRFIIGDFFGDNENDMNKYLKEISYIRLLSLNISDLLTGFLVLITYFRMKSEKEEETIKEISLKKQTILN